MRQNKNAVEFKDYNSYLEYLFQSTQCLVQEDRFESKAFVTVKLDKYQWDSFVKANKGEFIKDLDNYLYRTEQKKFYAVPNVDFDKRCAKGYKTITLSYSKLK